MAPPDHLVRVVRTPEGDLVAGRRLPGRGAWLCRGSPSCLALAERRKAFARALRAPVDPAAISALRARLTERARMETSAAAERTEAGFAEEDPGL